MSIGTGTSEDEREAEPEGGRTWPRAPFSWGSESRLRPDTEADPGPELGFELETRWEHELAADEQEEEMWATWRLGVPETPGTPEGPGFWPPATRVCRLCS